MFIKTNPHPQQKNTTDCVVRAYCIAFNKDYLETRKELNQKKKDFKFDSYKNSKFIHKYMEKLNCTKITIPVIKGEPRIKVADFCNLYSNGTYIVRAAHHLVCVKDGDILDTWNCGYKTAYTAWKIN